MAEHASVCEGDGAQPRHAPEVAQFLAGDGRQAGMELANNPAVTALSFTGSHAVGQQVYQALATRMARAQMEMGGKNPTIVFADTRGYHKGGLARERDRLMYTCMFTSQASQSQEFLKRSFSFPIPADRELAFALSTPGVNASPCDEGSGN